MNSIDNLREYVLTAPSICSTTRAILVGYIDGIDTEHQKVLDEWKVEYGQMWLKGYSECHAELLEGNETLASDLEGCGWVRLPVDADGVPIHVGDEVTCVLPFGGESKPFVVDRMELGRDGDGNVWSVALDRSTDCWEQPLLLRHHHAPTVEDVLYDSLRHFGAVEERTPEVDEWLHEQAAKLRLAGEE